MAPHSTGLDDDLFEFDELTDDGVAEPELDEQVAPEPRHVPRFEPRPRHVGLLDDYQPEPEPYEDDYEHDAPPHTTGPWLPPIVVPLLLVMAAANLALVGLTWKSMRAGETGLQVAVQPTAQAEPAGEPEPAPEASLLRRTFPQLASSRDDAWAILEGAQRALDAGEHVAARRTLYGMLTVIDRVEAAARPELEARATYLIAESYRLQARALGRPEEAP